LWIRLIFREFFHLALEHTMSNVDLGQLRVAYKNAVDDWIDTVRAEEALPSPDHSMVAMERWGNTHLKDQDAQGQGSASRKAYKEAPRAVNLGI
jgi:hypothetical protein